MRALAACMIVSVGAGMLFPADARCVGAAFIANTFVLLLDQVIIHLEAILRRE